MSESKKVYIYRSTANRNLYLARDGFVWLEVGRDELAENLGLLYTFRDPAVCRFRGGKLVEVTVPSTGGE